MRFTLLALPVLLLSSSFSVQAKMYKWVDENGQMHFGDKIPQKYMVKAHDELDENGIKVTHKAAEKTAQQKAEAKRLEDQREQARLEEEKKRKLDRVLLDAYDSEQDLIIARDSRLDAVNTQIQLSEAIIKQSNSKVETMQQQVAEIKASGREVPANLYKSIDIEKQQIASQTRVMASHKKRRDEISEKYNDYIVRYRDARAN